MGAARLRGAPHQGPHLPPLARGEAGYVSLQLPFSCMVHTLFLKLKCSAGLTAAWFGTCSFSTASRRGANLLYHDSAAQ